MADLRYHVGNTHIFTNNSLGSDTIVLKAGLNETLIIDGMTGSSEPVDVQYPNEIPATQNTAVLTTTYTQRSKSVMFPEINSDLISYSCSVTDNLGNLYVAGIATNGVFGNRVIFNTDGSASRFVLPDPVDNSLAYILKYDKNGFVQSFMAFDDNQITEIRSMTCDYWNNIYVLGNYVTNDNMVVYNFTQGDPAVSAMTLPQTSAAPNNTSTFIIMYGPTGSALKTTFFDSGLLTDPLIVALSSGGILVTACLTVGESEIPMFDFYYNSAIMPSSDFYIPDTLVGNDSFAVMWDSNGNLQRFCVFPSARIKVCSASTDSTFAIGYTANATGFISTNRFQVSNGVPIDQFSIPALEGSGYIIKYSANGTPSYWLKTVGLTTRSMVLDMTGNIYYQGNNTSTSLDITGPSSTNIIGNSIFTPVVQENSPYVVKYSAIGTPLYWTDFESAGSIELVNQCINVDKRGNIVSCFRSNSVVENTMYTCYDFTNTNTRSGLYQNIQREGDNNSVMFVIKWNRDMTLKNHVSFQGSNNYFGTFNSYNDYVLIGPSAPLYSYYNYDMSTDYDQFYNDKTSVYSDTGNSIGVIFMWNSSGTLLLGPFLNELTFDLDTPSEVLKKDIIFSALGFNYTLRYSNNTIVTVPVYNRPVIKSFLYTDGGWEMLDT